jgi:hypothetical protein
MDSLKSDLERLISAVESEEDFSKKLEKINKGTYQSFKDIRSSMTMVIGILKMHRDHWSVLLKGNQDININNES